MFRAGHASAGPTSHICSECYSEVPSPDDPPGSEVQAFEPPQLAALGIGQLQEGEGDLNVLTYSWQRPQPPERVQRRVCGSTCDWCCSDGTCVRPFAHLGLCRCPECFERNGPLRMREKRRAQPINASHDVEASCQLPLAVDSICEICKTFARVPFIRCNFCHAEPCYHHGRCCPRRRRPPPRPADEADDNEDDDAKGAPAPATGLSLRQLNLATPPSSSAARLQRSQRKEGGSP